MISILRDTLLFVFIFSFFNDNTLVQVLGSNALKIIFVLFMVVNIADIVKYTFTTPPNGVVKSYNIFIIILSIITLFSTFLFDTLLLIDALMVLISIHVVFIYVTYYQAFDKLIYFIWASVLISAVTSLFHDPITEYTFRTTGGTADPVEFSVHLFMGIFASIYLFQKNKNLVLLVPSILLFLYAMLYAGSKTAVVTIGILAFYVMLVRFKNIFRMIFSFKGLIVIALLVGVTIQTDLVNKLDAIQGMQERAKTMRTAETRFASWEAGMGMIRDHFFTGVGVNQFAEHAKDYLRVSFSDEGLLNPHNNFVKIFADTGIFSTLAFIVFLIILLKTNYLEIIESDYFWISLIPISSLMMGMALNTTYDKHFWLSLALLSHIILLTSYHKKEIE